MNTIGTWAVPIKCLKLHVNYRCDFRENIVWGLWPCSLNVFCITWLSLTKSSLTVGRNLTRKNMVAKIWQFPCDFHWPSFLLTVSVNLAFVKVSFTDNKMVNCMCDTLHWQKEQCGTFISSQHFHATSTCWCKADLSQAKPS